MTTTNTETVPGADAGYGARWARVPREVAYLLAKLPIALVGFVVTVSLFSAGVGTVVTFFIGVILAIAALYVARGFGTLELALLRWTDRPDIRRPEWQDARARTGFFGWLRAVLGNGHYWLYLLHTMVVDLLVGTVTWSITISWVAVGLGGVSYWFWDTFIPQGDNDWFLSEWILPRVGMQSTTIDSALVDNLINFIVGAVLLVTLPFITRALVSLHWVIARGMLGAVQVGRPRARSRERSSVRAGRRSPRRARRSGGSSATSTTVRSSGSCACRWTSPPPSASSTPTPRRRAGSSRRPCSSRRMLSRNCVRSRADSRRRSCMDRGLVAALESTAVRSPVPTRVLSELPGGTRAAAGDRAQRLLRRDRSPHQCREALGSDRDRGARGAPSGRGRRRRWLDVVVTDNGHGGAVRDGRTRTRRTRGAAARTRRNPRGRRARRAARPSSPRTCPSPLVSHAVALGRASTEPVLWRP